ncbi:uncharacterized protein JCM10292_006742 [Rhodotorula paludigena]|uniref:uncharacterized protein n=1 Tax=Rhodotorula paludigena TaxID=86838 RepID=UPI00316C451C
MAAASSVGPADPLIPSIALPVDPLALSRYLRSRQLAALRHLYEYKTLSVTQQIEEHAASRRGRHGRARRRRGSSPLPDERDLEAEEEEDEFEVRKKMRYDPPENDDHGDDAEPQADEAARNDDGTDSASVAESAATGATRGKRGSSQAKRGRSGAPREREDEVAVDSAHLYDYVFDLAPDSSADAYYHGPHPPPPARVVHTVLRATRKKPFVDPAGLSTAQLEALTRDLWASEGHGLSVFFGDGSGSAARDPDQPLSRDQERYQRELHAEAADEWEQGVIAGFSAACDERIGKSLARRPMTAREMQAQAAQQQQQLQQQGGVAAGGAQAGATAASAGGAPQQVHPAAAAPTAAGMAQSQAAHVAGIAGYAVPPSLSPFVERDRFLQTGGVPGWR